MPTDQRSFPNVEISSMMITKFHSTAKRFFFWGDLKWLRKKELRKNAAERNTKPLARRFSLFLYTVAA